MKCEVCKTEFKGRKDAKYCSPRCRKQAFQKRSIGTDNGTDNLVFAEPEGTDKFEFYTTIGANGTGRLEDEKSAVKEAKYWYQIPLGAIPVIQEGWPEMPEYMNGRQYFLWWKNEFEVRNEGKKSPFDGPILWNPTL